MTNNSLITCALALKRRYLTNSQHFVKNFRILINWLLAYYILLLISKISQ